MFPLPGPTYFGHATEWINWWIDLLRSSNTVANVFFLREAQHCWRQKRSICWFWWLACMSVHFEIVSLWGWDRLTPITIGCCFLPKASWGSVWTGPESPGDCPKTASPCASSSRLLHSGPCSANRQANLFSFSFQLQLTLESPASLQELLLGRFIARLHGCMQFRVYINAGHGPSAGCWLRRPPVRCSHVTSSNRPWGATVLTFHTVTNRNSHWSGQIMRLHVLERKSFKSSFSQPLTSSKHNIIGLFQLAAGLIHFTVRRSLWLGVQRGSLVLAQFPVSAEGTDPGTPCYSPSGPAGHPQPLEHCHRWWWVERLMQNNSLTCTLGGKKYSPLQEKSVRRKGTAKMREKGHPCCCCWRRV